MHYFHLEDNEGKALASICAIPVLPIDKILEIYTKKEFTLLKNHFAHAQFANPVT